ncbi:MAG: protein tyrosine phosphatase family protein [Chloroflexi bacterium]|nr:protein tyrosine phosphatase family protein [Chloroflexota bacterium]
MTAENIFNFLRLSENLMSSGMPTAEQMKSVAEAGVKVVINLAPFDPEKDLANEGALVESLGMKYINIPVDWEAPTQQNLETFMNAMDEDGNKKVFVHCRANYRATGFITLYRILRLGWRKEEAFKDLRRIWNPDEYPIWKKFIEGNLQKP